MVAPRPPRVSAPIDGRARSGPVGVEPFVPGGQASSPAGLPGVTGYVADGTKAAAAQR